MNVAIIDYGAGNLASAGRAIESLGHRASVVADPAGCVAADRLVLPGVGSFAAGMERLVERGWPTAIREMVEGSGIPLLGICLGMQLLGTSSPEGGETMGLGLIPGRMRHLTELGCDLRIPHVGWNEVRQSRQQDPMFASIPDKSDFYFVHSFAFVADEPDSVSATVPYGPDVTATIARGRVWGTQFHPEKSSKLGLQLLRNFIEHRHA